MISLIPQTPTTSGTPAAIVYNLPSISRDKEGQLLREMLEAIRNNHVPQVDKIHPLTYTWNQIDALHDLEENWGGCEVAAPDPSAIEQAKRWIASMHRDTKSVGLPWENPHVSASEDGDVSFEWWQGQKKLTVYVSATTTLLLKVWGLSITNQMAEGVAETIDERQSAWSWLLS